MKNKYYKGLVSLCFTTAVICGITITNASSITGKPVVPNTVILTDVTDEDKEELIPEKDIEAPIIERNSIDERKKAEANYQSNVVKQVVNNQKTYNIPKVSIPAGQVKEIFYQIAYEKGLSESEINGWAYIITRESGWNVTAKNPTSSAYGLPQALPGKKMASHGADWQTNPRTQLLWMYDYMVSRYGSIQGAVNFWNTKKWY